MKSPIGEKWPIGDFELGIDLFMIVDWGFKSPIPNPKNNNLQFKITYRQFYHHLGSLGLDRMHDICTFLGEGGRGIIFIEPFFFWLKKNLSWKGGTFFFNKKNKSNTYFLFSFTWFTREKTYLLKIPCQSPYDKNFLIFPWKRWQWVADPSIQT